VDSVGSCLRTTSFCATNMILRQKKMKVVVAACLALAAQADLRAQQPTSVCFHPHALPRCRSFLVFELEYATPLVSTTHVVSPNNPINPTPPVSVKGVDHMLVWHVGAMRNRDARSAIGGTIDIGFSGKGVRFGAQARHRWWLENNLSFEASAGPARVGVTDPGAGDAIGHRFGFTGGVQLSARDIAAATLSADFVPATQNVAALYGGIQARSLAGVIGSTLLGIGALVFAAVLGDAAY
jgi:hypothetical protein